MTEPTGSVDRRALKILLNAYWSSTGWQDGTISREDFEYAKRAGIMFDKVRLSHDDIVDRAISAVGALDRMAVADAFVASLSSRRLDLRSALGSFAVLQHFPRHRAPRQRGACPVCGEYNRGPAVENVNVLNFERFKWGGVRHDQPMYAGFDLQLFAVLPRVSVTKSDTQTLSALFSQISRVPPDTSSASLEKHLVKVFKSNKAEREVVIAILGLCGILESREHPGYLREFVPWSSRKLPARRFVDMAYPACWWQGADGVATEAIEYWFGHLL